MSAVLAASSIATLVGDFPRSPAWLGLSDALRALICDGRLSPGTRLPSERELTGALGVSRTTITRAYADLRERGFAESRRGSGTFTRLPGGRQETMDRLLTPRALEQGEDVIDLNCAATSAPPEVAAAYGQALEALPAYLGGLGYFPAGLPQLQQAIAEHYERRGLPTTPDQIMVTPGALAATAVVATALIKPGDRVLVESPVYPNAPATFARVRARLVAQPVEAFEVSAARAVLRQSGARAAYLIPDFQNPTGLVLSSAQRAEYAEALRASQTVAVIDECHHQLVLDDQRLPPPMAAYVEACGGEAITVDSMSKSWWGGLRVGWLRAPADLMPALAQARLALDLGAPVVEQLVAVELLALGQAGLGPHLARLRSQRDALAEALQTHLPDWSFTVPAGGLTLWCQLPAPRARALCVEAEAHGVVVAPGPAFAPLGGFGAHVRIPFTRPVDELREAVSRLAAAWRQVPSGDGSTASRPSGTEGGGRVLVA